MTVILLALVAMVAVVVAGAVVLARTSKHSFADDNVIVEGIDTGAPSAWAGAHTPEARLHRRIRDAVRAMQANVALTGELSEARERLEAEAVAIDRRLVAAAALPMSVRSEPMVKVEAAVVALERAAADAALGAQITDESVIGDTTDAITERLTAVAEARALLESEDYSPHDPADTTGAAAETLIPPAPPVERVDPAPPEEATGST